jgi:phosphopantothenate synthetase
MYDIEEYVDWKGHWNRVCGAETLRGAQIAIGKMIAQGRGECFRVTFGGGVLYERGEA